MIGTTRFWHLQVRCLTLLCEVATARQTFWVHRIALSFARVPPPRNDEEPPDQGNEAGGSLHTPRSP